MGNCFSSEDEKSKISLMEDFYYLYRDKKYLLRIVNDSIQKFKFDASIKIRKDSGIGYLNDGRIIIAGGTDSSGCLTSKAYIINPATCQVISISNLPVASKEGAFFHYKTCAFYVGGIKEADDEDFLAQEQSAPIMKYYIDEGYWDVFYHRNKNKLGFQDYLKKKLNDDENSENENSENEKELSLREIIYAGMFLLGSKVYFINGQRVNSKGILRTMNSVFSIDLEEDDFNFRLESCKCPIKVFRPVCGSYGDKGFITGGLKPSSKSCSMETFIFTVEKNEGKFTRVEGLKLALDDSYPVISTNKSYIALSYPNVAIYEYNENRWLMFTFAESLINRNTLKNPTPVLDTASFINKEVVKKEINVKAKLKSFGKTLDSENLDSGMSLSQP